MQSGNFRPRVTTMESFRWGQHFITGLTNVDQQHRALVGLINHLGELLTRRTDVAPSELENVFDKLTAYTQYHFREEENLMVQTGVDERHVSRHRETHANFLREVQQMHGEMDGEDRGTEVSLLRFLTYWLAYHILGSDQSLARQIKAIQSGTDAADAYVAEEQAAEGATEPLLGALNGLFKQVSKRNRELAELNRTLEGKVAERTRALSKLNEDLTLLVTRVAAEKDESRRLGRELAAANRHLEELALTDTLTELPNRRHALRRLQNLWSEAERERQPLACMMVDADGFKRINDSYGHEAGDAVLKALSRQLCESVRNDDIVCRLGGDEFLIICPNTPLDGVLHAAEIVRDDTAQLRVPAGDGAWQGSISVGVAVRQPEMTGPEALIKAADQSVYAAKKKGRNRVATAQELEPSNPAAT